jgi:hypothetical protein
VALLGLIVVALAVVAIVIASAPAPTRITLRNVVYSDVREASAALQDLVSKNTK